MKELKKRWTRVERAVMDGGNSWTLKEKSSSWNWANIQRNQILANWELRIWDGHDWNEPIRVSTLRDAKSIGRLLAVAAAANI